MPDQGPTKLHGADWLVVRATTRLVCRQWTPGTAPESDALQAGCRIGERRGYGRGFARGGGGVRFPS
jgi:hypothetical protein